MHAISIHRGRYSLQTLFSLGVICALSSVATGASTDDPPTYKAEGVYVNHLRVRVAPSALDDFEALMRRCFLAARDANLRRDLGWLCYHEAPSCYWILTMAPSEDELTYPNTLEGFVQRVGELTNSTALQEIQAHFGRVTFETEWMITFQQKAAWSSVTNMATATHPKARMIVRTVRPDMRQQFDAALSAYTQYLVAQNYELPIEGFAQRSGAFGKAFQVVFPRDWSSFYDRDSIEAFIGGLSESKQKEFSSLERGLATTITRIEYVDADFRPRFSYGQSGSATE